MYYLEQVLYRPIDPKDGGGYFSQALTVIDITEDFLTVRKFDGSMETLTAEEASKMYDDKLACDKLCWTLNGTGDPFVRLCSRNGIVTPEEKAAELKRQMEMWGARDYDDLLQFLE